MVESQRRISPLVLAVFVLIAGFAALVGWLQLSYEDTEPTAVAISVEKSEVVVTLSATPSTPPVATLVIAPPEKTETGGGVPSDQDTDNATPP